MTSRWHGGKGSDSRPVFVKAHEMDLRDELWRCKDEKRKAEILEELEQIKLQK